LIAGLFVLGVCLMILRRWQWGVISLSFAATAMGSSLLYLLEKRRRQKSQASFMRPNASGPYRTAPTTLLPQFVSHLAAVEAELQRTGLEEGWDIDWSRHQAASRNAQSFLAHNRLADALAELASALDVLMSGVQLHRKYRQHQARWGKPPRTFSKSDQDKGS